MQGLDYDAVREVYEHDLDRAVSFSGRGIGFFSAAKARVVEDVARRLLGLPAALRALDVGCGIGITDELLVDRFASLAGTDVTPGVLEQAAARNPGVEYALARDGRLPFDDASVDLAFTLTVLQVVPVPEQPAFLAELARVVRPGGIVLVYEHNPLNPLTRLAVRRCSFGHDAAMLGPGRTSRLLKACGLEVRERRYVLVSPWDSAPALLAERALRRLPLGAQYYVAGRRP